MGIQPIGKKALSVTGGCFLALFLACTAGCRELSPGVKGSGVTKTETREVSDFDEVVLDGIGRLVITIGKASPLSITADDNLMPLIETTVANRRLTIRNTQKFRPQVDLIYKLEVPNVKSLVLHGAANIQLTGIKNDALSIELNGAGDVVASGVTDHLTFKLAGAGSLKACELAAKTVDADVSGVGSAEVNAATTLKARVSGVGSIKYVGDPKVESQISGIGKVARKS